MIFPVFSSKMILSPSSLISTSPSSSGRLSLAKILSASESKAFTAEVMALSAGPGASWSGLISSGSMGFVELGTR